MEVMGVMEGPRRSRGSMAKPALPDGRTTPQRSSLSITGHAIIQGLASITKGCVWRAGITTFEERECVFSVLCENVFRSREVAVLLDQSGAF